MKNNDDVKWSTHDEDMRRTRSIQWIERSKSSHNFWEAIAGIGFILMFLALPVGVVMMIVGVLKSGSGGCNPYASKEGTPTFLERKGNTNAAWYAAKRSYGLDDPNNYK